MRPKVFPIFTDRFHKYGAVARHHQLAPDLSQIMHQ
jgi:hypothetical protein